MKCSICDRGDAKFSYHDWHCSVCEDSIRQAVGDLNEKDITVIFEGEEEYEDTPELP